MRIRSIKPEFWRSDDVNAMCIEDRLLFIGLWSYVDDNGVGIDRQADITADLFAHDLSVSPHGALMRVSDGLTRLAALGVIRRYTVAGKDFIEIANWAKHQRINRPSAGRYPRSDDPDAEPRAGFSEPSVSPHATPSPGAGEQGNRGTGDNPPLAPPDAEPGVPVARHPAPKPKGGAEVARRLNAAAHSPASDALVREHERRTGSPCTYDTFAAYAAKADEYSRRGIDSEVILDGIARFEKSDAFSVKQLDRYVSQAAQAAKTSGEGKPTTKARGYLESADRIIANAELKGWT